MNSRSMDFSLNALKARFEMQFYFEEFCKMDCGGGGGASYGYYGDSWGNNGYGDGYVGPYQVASDNSGAMLDDGSFTDGTTGGFPANTSQSIPFPERVPRPSLCNICRC